jgi:hypothetical protein
LALALLRFSSLVSTGNMKARTLGVSKVLSLKDEDGFFVVAVVMPLRIVALPAHEGLQLPLELEVGRASLADFECTRDVTTVHSVADFTLAANFSPGCATALGNFGPGCASNCFCTRPPGYFFTAPWVLVVLCDAGLRS